MTVSEEIKLQAKLLEWEAPNGLWLTEPDTREVVGVIAGIREALSCKKGDKNGRN